MFVAAALDTRLVEFVKLAETKEIDKVASLVAAILALKLGAMMVEEPMDGAAEGTLLMTGATGAARWVSAGGTMAGAAGEMMGTARGAAAAGGTEDVTGRATGGSAGGATVAIGATVVAVLGLVFASEGTSGAILRGGAGTEVVGVGAGVVEVVVTGVTIVLLSVTPEPGT